MGGVRELSAQVVILGGGTGGVAAALAAARRGATVILTEETDWLGGQLTSQAVPPDEHPWVAQFGITRSYRRFRDLVRQYYFTHYPMTSAARSHPALNPGSGWVGHFCHEPRIALAVLEAMLAPWRTAGRVQVLLRHRPVAAEMEGDRVRAVRVRDLESGEEKVLIAPYFVDATETGEILPLTGTEYVTGFESQKDTGEPSAPAEAQPLNMQAFTMCFAMEYRPGENHVIDRPENYNFWRDYVPSVKPAWPGRLIQWDMPNPQDCKRRPMGFDPFSTDFWAGDMPNLYSYRQIVDPANMESGALGNTTGATIVNWPQNDYLLGNLVDVSDEEFARHVRGGIELSRSLLYWMQTEAPRADGGTGWPGLRLRGDMLGTEHGCAKYPYIRESRRLRAEVTVVEQHISAPARAAALSIPVREATAEQFPDSVGVGAYRIDLHPSTGGDNYIDVSCCPFQIPLGALIPRRVENLLAGAKNLGVTHITNGCYRVHPVEWNIGESAGSLAAWCAEKGETPRAVRASESRLKKFQKSLQADGIELEWPRVRPL